MLISSVGPISVGTDPDAERRPPSAPSPLEFPAYSLPGITHDDSDPPLNRLYGKLMSIKRPQDISVADLKALNLQLETDVPVSQVVPDNQKFSLPPLPWEIEEPSEEEGQQQADSRSEPTLMSNGFPYPPKARFDLVRNELLVDNDDAFREVVRLGARPGRQRVRLTQTRNFWAGLERMSQYWDTSLDNYYERPASPRPTPAEGESADKMQIDDEKKPSPAKAGEGQSETPMDIDSPAATPSDPSSEQQNAAKEQEPPMVTKYKGRRLGSGYEMPDETRDETVKGFLEMAAWPFGCQVTIPNLPPRLAIRNLLFPVRQSLVSGRSPKDRQAARKGVLEGPLLIAQCRPDTIFRRPEDAPGTGLGEVCDIFREVGAMLLAAEERAREGKKEVRPGEGQWWTTKPRWGGARNDDVGENAGTNSDEQPAPDSAGNARKRSKHDHPLSSSRKSSSRKLTNVEKWKIVQPGPSLWDKRMTYMRIGKDKESPFDDV